MPTLRLLALAASVFGFALAPDVGAADPLLETDPVSVSVGGDPVLEAGSVTVTAPVLDPVLEVVPLPVPEPVLEVGPVSVSVGGDVLGIETGTVSVGGSDPAPASPSPAAPGPAGPPGPAGSQGASAQGTSTTSTASTVPVSSVINTTSGQSVSAQGANGVRIAKVRYITRNVHRTGRVTMIVTVKDRRGLLVRGAKVRIRGVAKTNFLTLQGAQTKATSKVGQATFSFKLNKRNRTGKSLGKRFVVASIASTPTATTELVSSFRVPLKRARTS